MIGHGMNCMWNTTLILKQKQINKKIDLFIKIILINLSHK
jgi:hypothetical protein